MFALLIKNTENMLFQPFFTLALVLSFSRKEWTRVLIAKNLL